MSESATDDGSDLRFFDGFSWAVPVAFAGALAGYRFELGDVLHRSRDAYAAEPPAQERRGETDALAIQVLEPPRSARGVGGDADRDRRRASFESEVQLLLVDVGSGERRTLETTQGRLLMTLWHGDLGWIEGEGDPPAVPLGARSLAGELAGLRAAFEAELFGRGDRPESGMLFLFVVDLASDASRVKAASIREALAFSDAAVWLDRTPGALGLEAASAYHPALIVRGVAMPDVDEARVTAALRGVLYGGKAGSMEEASAEAGAAREGGEGEAPAADRFSVARHGLLVPLGA